MTYLRGVTRRARDQSESIAVLDWGFGVGGISAGSFPMS